MRHVAKPPIVVQRQFFSCFNVPRRKERIRVVKVIKRPHSLLHHIYHTTTATGGAIGMQRPPPLPGQPGADIRRTRMIHKMMRVGPLNKLTESAGGECVVQRAWQPAVGVRAPEEELDAVHEADLRHRDDARPFFEKRAGKHTSVVNGTPADVYAREAL